MNQMQALLEKAKNDGELNEEDLEAAAGGATQNRYDPQRCGNTTRVLYECVGFLTMTWCDHFTALKPEFGSPGIRYTCAMGRYDYYGDPHGDPV